ncbi:MAG TPA: hypothetical protein VK212_06745 [Lentimicrobium sp.]|nr:hypothetical protein [Lentimicrobium sp.]
MSFLKNIRIYLGKRSLRSEVLKTTRIKRPVNLTNAGSIGIIYLLSSEEEYNRVSSFTKKLQDKGKKVHVIGLYHYNRIPVFYIPKLSYDLLLPSDIDILYRPDAPFVKQFVNEEFDMLIDLSNPDNFTLHYISSLSKAHFKIGKKIDDRPLPYDLMIDTSEEISSQELIDQIVYYTSNLDFRPPEESIS